MSQTDQCSVSCPVRSKPNRISASENLILESGPIRVLDGTIFRHVRKFNSGKYKWLLFPVENCKLYSLKRKMRQNLKLIVYLNSFQLSRSRHTSSSFGLSTSAKVRAISLVVRQIPFRMTLILDFAQLYISSLYGRKKDFPSAGLSFLVSPSQFF